jgi:hypothetical protein
MSTTHKWLVTFSTTQSKGILLKETIEAISWQYAKLSLESKYSGIKINNYTPVR